MGKLSILITQYKETQDIIKPLLDSINIQQGIDFKENLEVIIGNDGSDVLLPNDFLNSYSYQIEYRKFEHINLPGCRKNLFPFATGDYVMWCDADDMFNSPDAIAIMLQEMDKGKDAFVSSVLQELVIANDEKIYNVVNKNTIWVHGKVYRRQFLIDNKIVWHPELTCHEDSCFNVLALTLAKDKVCFYDIPLYIWKYRPVSICRGDDLYLPKTWCAMINSYDMLVEDFQDRGYGLHSKFYSYYCLVASYYEMSREEWRRPESIEYAARAYKKLVEFYNKRYLLLKNFTETEYIEKCQQMNEKLAKENGVNPDAMSVSFSQWIESLLTIYG